MRISSRIDVILNGYLASNVYSDKFDEATTNFSQAIKLALDALVPFLCHAITYKFE